MFSLSDLRFAYRYPFSSNAKTIAKLNSFDLNDLPDKVKERASIRVVNAFNSRDYVQEYITDFDNSKDLMLNEVLSFGIAKLLIALTGSDSLKKKFAQITSNACFYFLENEKDKKTVIELLAKDLGFNLSFNDSYFVVSLNDFISVSFFDKQLFLVNQKLEKGKVFLDLNSIIRFISKKVYLTVLNSFDFDLKDVPQELKKLSSELKIRIQREQKRIEVKLSGNVRTDLFPPCMHSLYSRLIAGENLAHNERFALATFLVQVNMPVKSIIQLFKKAPNFNEKITRYQVERIKKKNYSAPSCDTLRQQGIECFSCNARHPVQFYKQQLLAERKNYAKKKDEGESIES